MNFASDNWASLSTPIAHALANAGQGFAPAYGADDLSQAVEASFSELFEKEVGVFFVGTGTAANALALAAVMRPAGVVLCHETSHIVVDEAGAVEFFSGGRLLPLSGKDGRLTVEGMREALCRFDPPSVHHGRPVAVSLTQASEWGTVYKTEEIAAIAALAHGHGLRVHMDGARFANALVHLNATPAELTWRAGVDLLSFGATKNGCWCAEALILFDKALAEDVAYARKRAGQLFSKSRFIAAQFLGYLKEEHWLENARHANLMAKDLAAGIVRSKNARLVYQPEANEVFAILSKDALARLEAAKARFYRWPAKGISGEIEMQEGEEIIRLVTSFATQGDEVTDFLNLIR